MNTKHFSMLLLATIISITSFAQDTKKSASIKVWGNCGMCEATIEKAAKKAGASVAEWNSETLMLSVAYNEKTSDLLKIQKAIAAAGYDTQDLKGSDKAYDKLHGCCKYDRKPEADPAASKEVAMDHTDCGKGCCSK